MLPRLSVRFQVTDLGKGRVALKVGNGRLVSVGDSGVVLKDLAGAAPADAESFQWVNLLRGDTMLMSLTNHRYLATKPNRPGPVTASATGPRPDRKDGACFKWRAVSPSLPTVSVAVMQAVDPHLKEASGKLLKACSTSAWGSTITSRIEPRIIGCC